MVSPQAIDHSLEAVKIRTEADDVARELSDKARQSARVLSLFIEAHDYPDLELNIGLPAMGERESHRVGEEVAALFKELLPDLPIVYGWGISFHDPERGKGPHIDLDIEAKRADVLLGV